MRYSAVDHIRVGYRHSTCGVHSIYYKFGDDGISEVVRIIRGQSTDDIKYFRQGINYHAPKH
jgi:toxin ParE1/3/4